MEHYTKIIQKIITANYANLNLDGVDLEVHIQDTLDEVVERIEFVFKGIQEERNDLSLRCTKCEDEFKQKNYLAWEVAFKQTEAFIEIIHEIINKYRESIEELDNSIQAKKKKQHDVFLQLYARTFQEFLEIFTLLKNGFPSGGMSRWRTINERVIIATFIATSSNAEEVATAFIEYANHSSEDEEISNDYYDWAKKDTRFISKINSMPQNKQKKMSTQPIKFSMIRKECPVEKIYLGESYYKFASSLIHASPKGTYHSMAEPSTNMLCVGQSSYGIAEPAIQAIHSLVQMTKFYLSVYASQELLIYIGIISKFDELLYNTYMEIEEKLKNYPIKEMPTD